MCSNLVGSLWVNLFSFSQGFLITCTCDLWLVVLQGFNQACIFKNYFHVSLQIGKMVMKEKCLWCMVMSRARATLFILRGPFRIRKDPNSQTPGREHAPRTALQTEGTVQWKDQKKMASMELQWQCWPPGECRRTMHSRSVRVTNTGTGA